MSFGIEDAIQEALLDAFEDKDEDGYETSTVGSAFFRDWFKEGGNAYSFVFHKNLSVTNMQYAELVALISTNAFDITKCEPVPSLQFVSSHDFVQTVNALLQGIPGAPSPEDPHVDKKAKGAKAKQLRAQLETTWRNAARWFADTYAHMLYYTAVMDPFFGSASVYLPAHLDVNLQRICGRAGYIHSCGRNVFVRNVSKARLDHFSKAIERHLERFGSRENGEVFFTVFAHEDFDPHETRKSELRDGLDDIKIHIDKSFMGRNTLVDVVAQLKKTFEGRLEVADPDHFARKERLGPRIRTMWLISDYGIQRQSADGEDYIAKSPKRYYICYDQIYDNQNPFHLFDENKPAWVAHTTIPHMLMAAMINVTAPSWSDGGVLVADPFVGSGTTWIEGWKYPELTVVAGDKSPLAVTAARDNARFFSHKPATLRWLSKIIRAVATCIEKPEDQDAIRGTLGEATGGAVADHVSSVHSWVRTREIDDASAEAFLAADENQNETTRLLFYLVLRSLRRHDQALKRNAHKWLGEFRKAFAQEAEALARQMDLFANLKERAVKSADGVLCVCSGDYSDGVTITASRLAALRDLEATRPPQIALAQHLTGTFDIVITDPPYGFNTDEDPQSLALLYREVLRAAIQSLKPNGEIVICLPERSTIGKDPAAFTHRRIVTHQILSFAAEMGRRVFLPAWSVPGPSLVFQPPYYWVSGRLRRAILHFKFTGVVSGDYPELPANPAES